MAVITRLIQTYRKGGARGLKNAIALRLLRGRSQFDPMPIALNTILAKEDFTIIQIGAYVGDSENDPLFCVLKSRLNKGKGRLICVEPVKEYFDALVDNYRNTPNVFFENVAIAERNGAAAFYRLSVNPIKHGYPEWLSQLGSLKKERMESLWDNYEANEKYKTFYLQHRIEEAVQCITFSELLRRHNARTIDLLQIDTEGYEWEILATIDFSSVQIRFINYESVLLSRHKDDAESLMRAQGYLLVDHGQDTFCHTRDDPDFQPAKNSPQYKKGH